MCLVTLCQVRITETGILTLTYVGFIHKGRGMSNDIENAQILSFSINFQYLFKMIHMKQLTQELVQGTGSNTS